MVTTPLSTEDQLRLVVDELRAIRRSLNRITTLLMIIVVPFAAFVAGVVLNLFFPQVSIP